jgi:hypothetical protein
MLKKGAFMLESLSMNGKVFGRQVVPLTLRHSKGGRNTFFSSLLALVHARNPRQDDHGLH